MKIFQQHHSTNVLTNPAESREVMDAPSLQMFKVRSDRDFEQSDLVGGIPTHVRKLGTR